MQTEELPQPETGRHSWYTSAVTSSHQPIRTHKHWDYPVWNEFLLIIEMIQMLLSNLQNCFLLWCESNIDQSRLPACFTLQYLYLYFSSLTCRSGSIAFPPMRPPHPPPTLLSSTDWSLRGAFNINALKLKRRIWPRRNYHPNTTSRHSPFKN